MNRRFSSRAITHTAVSGPEETRKRDFFNQPLTFLFQLLSFIGFCLTIWPSSQVRCTNRHQDPRWCVDLSTIATSLFSTSDRPSFFCPQWPITTRPYTDRQHTKHSLPTLNTAIHRQPTSTITTCRRTNLLKTLTSLLEWRKMRTSRLSVVLIAS